MKTPVKIIFGVLIGCQTVMVLHVAISMFRLCTHHRYYTFEIENRTPYRLDSIQVCTASGRNFALAPGETSETFTFDQRPLSDFFAESQLCVTVLQYTNGDSTYQNTLGSAIGFSILREGEVNMIVIDTAEPISADSPYTFETRIEVGKFGGIRRRE